MKKSFQAEIILVILGSVLYFFANFQRVAVPGAFFGILQNDLMTSAQCIASLGAIFMYVYAIGQLIIGVLVARYGGFRVVAAGAILFFIGCIMFPFSESLYLLYISRFLIGLGSASFYLGMINETRRIVPKKNFGIVLSLILFVGYLGGIVANAPLVICINKIGWRNTFCITAAIVFIITVGFLILNKMIKHVEVDKTVHLDFELFKETFANKKNIDLYSFACLNYGLYYVIQTVIGKKFLEDFCFVSEINAALVLSSMGALYAISGSILAFVSKLILNRRTVFLKISALNTLFVFCTIFLLVFFNIKTPLISLMFCTIAFGAGLSPLLIPLLHDYNGAKVANTAISAMTCGFYLVVAVLGNIIGWCLDTFDLTNNMSYIVIFGFSAVLSVISFINVFKIKESQKTVRLIEHVQYVREHENECDWHDEHEHNIYNNI